IFRDFADLKQTPAAIVHFANRYGDLRGERMSDFSFWLKGIQQMGDLVRLSDAVTTGDWKRIPQALQTFLADASLATSAELRPLRQKQKRSEVVTRNDQTQAAIMRLYHAIAPVERFNGTSSWNSLTGNVEVRLVPADLLGFMFLQLGGALIGGRRF